MARVTSRRGSGWSYLAVTVPMRIPSGKVPMLAACFAADAVRVQDLYLSVEWRGTKSWVWTES